MKTYTVFKSGSTQYETIKASCITKACKLFINGLEKPAKYELDKLTSLSYATIRYLDNYTICSDFVLIEEC